MISPRPNQKDILKYRYGNMGISAVPGSGKTWTLSLLAVEILRNIELNDDQDILIVTLSNSAVENFRQRITGFKSDFHILTNTGFRIRTLHGLAHDIVRWRPDLAGVGEDFNIIDTADVDSILTQLATNWLKLNRSKLDPFISYDTSKSSGNKIEKDSLPYLIKQLAVQFIRTAKDNHISSEEIMRKLDQVGLPLPLAEVGAEIYRDYQNVLAYRGALDFDDLIIHAYKAIQNDEEYLKHLRYMFPYILEDEAQDSSRLQEEILKLLVGPGGNWIRVGDPNQAIYESFTTANPRYLRQYLKRENVDSRDLPHSSRSNQNIIDLANYLVSWNLDSHSSETVRDALSGPPFIIPVPDDDPSPNPPVSDDSIRIVMSGFRPYEEIEYLVEDLKSWLPQNPDATVAVLEPMNYRCGSIADSLKKNGLEVVDSLFRTSQVSQDTAGAISNYINYLLDPQNNNKLKSVLRVWKRHDRTDEEMGEVIESAVTLIYNHKSIEDYLYPLPDRDWLASLDPGEHGEKVIKLLRDFRRHITRWHKSISLPMDQLIISLGQELFTNPLKLAIVHKIAGLMKQSMNLIGSDLAKQAIELQNIAQNRRKFTGLSADDLGFDPDRHKGKVVVSTYHKAKGLEWDRVYLMGVNNYNFPAGLENESYAGEKYFVTGKMNLPAEAISQLKALMSSSQYDWYEPGKASKEELLEYVRERLRLLYVGITRAKKELIITWNTGSRNNLQPAESLKPLYIHQGGTIESEDASS